jgi:hypothetical protein
MGRCVIRQPDGRYAVFSSGTDVWVAFDMTRDQYIAWRTRHAVTEAMTDAARLLDDVDAGLVDSGYSFEEANAQSVAHGGRDLIGPRLTHAAVRGGVHEGVRDDCADCTDAETDGLDALDYADGDPD